VTIEDIVLDDLERGDREEILISELEDGSGNPAVFSASDVLRWTAKRSRSDSDRVALYLKTSTAGGITFTPGADNATVVILPADHPTIPGDIEFLWDLQLTPGGDVTQTVTIAKGTGRVVGDVSSAAP